MDIMAEYDHLTKSEQRVLVYIIDHQDELPSMNIEDLAEKAFVSKTVVINLSQKIGFSGFRELKYHFKAQNKSVPKQTLDTNDIRNVVRRTVDKTFALSDDDTLERCANLIVRANNLFIMARGTSKPVAYYLEHVLFSIGFHCYFIDDYNLSETFTDLVTKQDAVLLISLSGETPKILSSARKVRLRQAPLMSLTGFTSNHLAELSDEELFCFTESDDTKTGDSISRIGFFVVVDLLVGHIKNKM